MNRQTIVVEGTLAYRMQRFRAAKNASSGLEILTMPLLAARLAGGFLRPAGSQDVEPLIRTALEAEVFSDLVPVKDLPGMTRAVQRTLRQVWSADLSLVSVASTSSRLSDLCAIEDHIRKGLPRGVLLPRDLRDRALRNVGRAPTLLGEVTLDGLLDVPIVWRPLVEAIGGVVRVSWHQRTAEHCPWFTGPITRPSPTGTPPEVVSCANPRSEVVEALRWLRDFIATNRVHPSEIGLCAADTGAWDQHLLVLSRDAELPIHFSHGIPALATVEGQSCAALADVLLRGLSLDRVRRVAGHALKVASALKDLSADWSSGLNDGAALFDVSHWNRALGEAFQAGRSKADPRAVLLPVLELMEKGIGGAHEAGNLLLGSKARELWAEALRRAPANALDFSLRELRVRDDLDPATAAVWCPADHLAGSPRRYVRLLGLASRLWPRRDSEDPLIPSHVLSREVFGGRSVAARDRLAFRVVTEAAEHCILSFSRRDAQGKALTPSALVPLGASITRLRQDRTPAHAYSESDRLLARPREAASKPSHAAAADCWRNWHRSSLSRHDGWVRSNHPVIGAALARTHSATSLRYMLRDPSAFLWRYALGWHSVDEEDRPLGLDQGSFGELVHELLKRAVDILNPNPGYARADLEHIEAAITQAAEFVRTAWPPHRRVPPALLWAHTLTSASRMALRALTGEPKLQADSKSWTEVSFGLPQKPKEGTADVPWDPTIPVPIPGTAFHVRGTIDRVDIRADGAVRVSDYKTGIEPEDIRGAVMKGGAELQRVIYAIAARQLVPTTPGVISRLLYLSSSTPQEYRLANMAEAISDIASYVSTAADAVKKGLALPGPAASEDFNEYAIALPAMRRIYLQRKRSSIHDAFGVLVEVWRCR